MILINSSKKVKVFSKEKKKTKKVETLESLKKKKKSDAQTI